MGLDSTPCLRLSSHNSVLASFYLLLKTAFQSLLSSSRAWLAKRMVAWLSPAIPLQQLATQAFPHCSVFSVGLMGLLLANIPQSFPRANPLDCQGALWFSFSLLL